jgi:acetyl esterase/lipase
MKILIFVLFLTSVAFAGEPKVIPLWPGIAPGSEKWSAVEEETIGQQDNVRRIRNVVTPTVTAYLPDRASANGTAVIVCPGGGFTHLAIDYEGHDVAKWLNSLGIAAFVLKYRVAQTDAGAEMNANLQERIRAVIPLAIADGLQAMRVVRSHAVEWGIKPDRIGIIGFSAGGLVAICVALDRDSENRPGFLVPIYAAVPEEFTVPPNAPPLFLVHADDDRRLGTVDNSIRLYSAWKKAQVPAELHIYARGGHGFGMKRNGLPVDSWTDRFRDWLDAQNLLKPLLTQSIRSGR